MMTRVLLLALLYLCAVAPIPQWAPKYSTAVFLRGFFGNQNLQLYVDMDPSNMGNSKERVDYFSSDRKEHVVFLYRYDKGVQYIMDLSDSDSPKCWADDLPFSPPQLAPLNFQDAQFVGNETKDGKQVAHWIVTVFPKYQLQVDYYELISDEQSSYSIPYEINAINGGLANLQFQSFSVGAPSSSLFEVLDECPSLEHPSVESLCVGEQHFKFTATSFLEMNKLLYPRSRGWISGDGADSHLLPNDRIGFSFNDGGFGYTLSQQRIGPWGIIHNMVAILQNATSTYPPSPSQVDFYVGYKAPGAIQDMFQPSNWNAANNFYWIALGPVFDDVIYGQAQWFSPSGESFVRLKISNASQTPDEWNYTTKPIQFPSMDNDVRFAGAVRIEGDTVYILGSSGEGFTKNLYIARASLDDWKDANLEKMEFWTEDEEWSTWSGKDSLQVIASAASDCTTLNYNTFMQEYYLTLIKGSEIYVATSPKITGPFTSHLVAEVPAPLDDDYWVYCANAHPELAQSEEEIVLSYFTNAASEKLLTKVNPNSYWARFIRVEISNGPGGIACLLWWHWLLIAIAVVVVVAGVITAVVLWRRRKHSLK